MNIYLNFILLQSYPLIFIVAITAGFVLFGFMFLFRTEKNFTKPIPPYFFWESHINL